MSQLLTTLAAQALALLVYPGLVTTLAFGAVFEVGWTRLSTGGWAWPAWPRRRPTPVVVTVAICSMVAASQVAVPGSPMAPEDRSLVLAAIALAMTAWAALALGADFFADPGLLLAVQLCWLLAILGPAVQPQSLRPQVLGNVLVSGLLPVKIASAVLYGACLPALLGLWPLSPEGERRAGRRLDAARALTWFPYCALFTTLFVPPPHDDVVGLLGFAGITAMVALAVLVIGLLMHRGRARASRAVYARVLPPFAGAVLIVVVATSFLMR